MWLKQQGEIEVIEADGLVRRANTMQCGHCNRITIVPAKCDPADLGGFCTCCAKLICKNCVGKGCDPLEEKLRRWERPSPKEW